VSKKATRNEFDCVQVQVEGGTTSLHRSNADATLAVQIRSYERRLG
jgi:hypothetical protein